MQKLIKSVETLEELKQAYKKLALIHHPDRGGNEELMKQLNNEYDELFEKLKSVHKNKEGVIYNKETQEEPRYWKEIIAQLLGLKMVDVTIEVIGSFLWVSGKTMPYKDELKKLEMKWSRGKESWYLSPPGYKKYTHKKYDLDDIRGMYGSQQFHANNKKVLSIGNRTRQVIE